MTCRQQEDLQLWERLGFIVLSLARAYSAEMIILSSPSLLGINTSWYNHIYGKADLCAHRGAGSSMNISPIVNLSVSVRFFFCLLPRFEHKSLIHFCMAQVLNSYSVFWFLFLASKLLAFPNWVNYCGVQGSCLARGNVVQNVFLPYSLFIWQCVSDTACVMWGGLKKIRLSL